MFKGLFRERRRSIAAQGLAVPGTAPDPAFDGFVDAAAAAFNAPIAALSLIHDEVQSIMTGRGVMVGCIARSGGFCNFALDRFDVLECCDPEGDERFAHLPVVVGDPHVRYYIGAPLRLLSGIDVGALCVADTVSRPPASSDQKAYLFSLARQASMALEARSQVRSNAA